MGRGDLWESSSPEGFALISTTNSGTRLYNREVNTSYFWAHKFLTMIDCLPGGMLIADIFYLAVLFLIRRAPVILRPSSAASPSPRPCTPFFLRLDSAITTLDQNL
jgi:hypothetical protein